MTITEEFRCVHCGKQIAVTYDPGSGGYSRHGEIGCPHCGELQDYLEMGRVVSVEKARPEAG